MSAILPPRHPLGVARARQPRDRGARRSRRAVRPGWPLLLVLLLGALVPGGCRGTLPGEETPTGVSLTLDIVPLILRADTTQTAAVWVTILDGGAPIADSTRVSLVATLGRVSAEAYT
ncbi:MAG: hypothetical protein FJY75_06580, partial [Candidatus Eisenbacteria bacterium]|nr:hypothetical protein [Candidatus Eisenbacteria bacterium]